MKYRLVLFDLDGTLLDTLDDLSEAVNDAFRNYRFRGYTVEDIGITVVCHPRGSSR